MTMLLSMLLLLLKYVNAETHFVFCSAVPVWLEYVQFAIGGMGHSEGVQKARTVFDQALTACGLHVSKGSDIWDAYREFEIAILSGLLVCEMKLIHFLVYCILGNIICPFFTPKNVVNGIRV